MFTILKFLSQIVAGYAVCWFAVYLLIALPHATPMQVITGWDNPEYGSLIVFGASLALYLTLSVLYIFIKSYKQ
ncbi:MAG: hypothetical protein AB3N28_00785 [Kordiimonas sp.]